MNPYVRFAPAALLVCVALFQIYTALTADLVSSKGGGFGMFAVTDMRASRTWSAECMSPQGEPCLVFLPRIESGPGSQFFQRLRAYPDVKTMAAAADWLARSRFVRAELETLSYQARLAASSLADAPEAWRELPVYRLARSDEQGEPLAAVRLRVWRMAFDSASASYTLQPVGPAEERGRW